MKLLTLLSLCIVGAFIMSNAQAEKSAEVLIMELEEGSVHIQMRPDLAPNHVARIKELVKDGFYDGIVFHRVIEGFMAQTGDPTGSGSGGSGQKLKAEFSNAKHVRGTVSMARAGHPDSADSQFFIVFQPSEWLDGQYTVWGQVIEGMEHIDTIQRGEPPVNPNKIISMKLKESDAAAPAEATEEEASADEASKTEAAE